MRERMRQIVICGGGIGGLSAALSLAKCGFPTVVLERAPAFAEIGAGIQLGPNALHVLATLGILGAVNRTAVLLDRCRLMDAITAAPVAELTIDDRFVRRFGHPYAVVHRAELHAHMLESCRDSGLVELHTNAAVARFEREDAGVVVELASGELVRGCALVGADGLWSIVRRDAVDATPPRVTGHTTYRALIPVDRMPEDVRWNDMALWAGPKCHIVHYPLSGWKLFNLVATFHNNAPEPVAGLPVTDDEVRAGFSHLHPTARRIVETGRDWRKWVLCDREPLSDWTRDRVTLLGDAAHPTLQYMAQGACMAMEDGMVLAAEVAASPDRIDDAFRRYQARRLERTARIVLLARAMGDHVLHPSGIHATLRNSVMGAKSQADWHDLLAWLYDAADVRAAARTLSAPLTITRGTRP